MDVDLTVLGSYDPATTPPQFPDLQGHAKASGISISTQSLPAPVTGGELSIILSPNQARLATLAARIGESDLRCEGSVDNIQSLVTSIGRPKLSVTLVSDLLNLDELTSGPDTKASFSFTTPLYAAPPEPASTSVLAGMFDVEGRARIAKVISGGLLTDVGADLELQEGYLKVDDVAANAYGGRFEGAFEADLAPEADAIPAKMRIAIKGGQADGVLQNFFNLPLPIAGDMGLKLSGTADLDSTFALIPGSLNLDGLADIAKGEIKNWDWLKASTGSVTQLSFFDFDRIPIKDVATHIQVEKDRLFTRDLELTASEISCEVSGSIGLSDQSLDYTVDLDIPAEKLSVGGVNVGQALGSLLGGNGVTIPLTLKIGGTVTSPNLTATVAEGTGGKTQEKKSLMDSGKSLLKRFRSPRHLKGRIEQPTIGAYHDSHLQEFSHRRTDKLCLGQNPRLQRPARVAPCGGR